jgi:hypothetical protein
VRSDFVHMEVKLAKKTNQGPKDKIKKKTTIGSSVRTRPKSFQQKLNFKKYRGQGR